MNPAKNIKSKIKIKASNVYITLLVVIAALIPLTGFYYSFQEHKLANIPVDVLTDWSLHVDDSHPYHPGDSLTITSQFTKLVSVTGESERSIQCLKLQYVEEVRAARAINPDYKIPNNYWDGYNSSNTIKATQPRQKAGQGIFVITIPFNVGNQANVCRPYISVTYNVNKFHPRFQESNYGNVFYLEPRPGVVDQGAGQTYVYTNDPNIGSSGAQSSIAVPEYPTSPVIIYQTVPSDEDAPATNPQRPSLLDRVENIVNKIGL